MLFGSACMNWEAYSKEYDVRAVADAVVDGDGGLYTPAWYDFACSKIQRHVQSHPSNLGL
jgi:hypothetical protein